MPGSTASGRAKRVRKQSRTASRVGLALAGGGPLGGIYEVGALLALTDSLEGVDFSDLEIGPDGSLYLLSDKSSTIARLDNLPAGGGTAKLLDMWELGDLDGKPEGLTFTAQGHAIVGLDTRKPRRNLLLLEPAIARSRP